MKFLEQFITQNKAEVQAWVEGKLKLKEPFFYNSCDVRFAGFKITQVDANCFPAGFNNLSLESYKLAVGYYKEFFERKKLKSILIFPEFHTRNYGYLKNVRTLKAMFEEAGVKVRIATDQEYKFNIDLSVSEIKSISEELGLEGNSLDFDPIKKHKWFFQKKYKIGVTSKDCEEVKAGCFVADAVVLNNDLTTGMPEVLKNIEAEIIPSYKLGWFNRKKTEHFKFYSQIVNECANEFKIDPWLFDAYFEEVENVHFKTGEGFEELAQKIELVYGKIAKKYQEYGLSGHPSIFIKSNKGTYGMGIHVVSSPEEVKDFNKNIRKKMAVVKDGTENTSLIIQEGVPTIFAEEGRSVEPVVYSALSKPIGMFFRVNDGNLANLNSKGMELKTEFPGINEWEKELSLLVASFSNLAVLEELASKS